MLVVRGKGGKERLVPLNERGPARMADVSQTARARRARRNRNGCFRPSASRATSPASILPAN